MVKIDHVSFSSKQGKLILNNVTCEFHEGKLTAVLGANGAGKSTLFKCVASEINIDKGNVFWYGQAITAIPLCQISKERAILRQHYQVSLDFKAIEIIEMGRYAYNKSVLTDRCNEVVQLVASLVGVTHLLERSYFHLSGGEQQRVQLARVLAQIWDSPTNRRVLLLDEPVSALDIQYQHQLMQLMKHLVQVHQFTVVAIVHDLNLTNAYADNVVLMKAGAIIASGTVAATLNEDNIAQCFDVSVKFFNQDGAPAFIQVLPNNVKEFKF